MEAITTVTLLSETAQHKHLTVPRNGKRYSKPTAGKNYHGNSILYSRAVIWWKEQHLESEDLHLSACSTT